MTETDGTLDLTKIKLTLGQFIMFVLFIAASIGSVTVSLYQLSEVRKAQQEFASLQISLSTRLQVLENDKARREGIEYGQAHPNEKGVQ